MRVVEEIDLTVIQEYLRAIGSGVKLDPHAMPGPLDQHRAYRVLLDGADVADLVLYWEFQKYTKGESCKVTELLESSGSLKRVRSFIDGDPAKGFLPLDLRTIEHKEPVIVTDRLGSSFQYVIDGNHRIIAQHVSGKGFAEVPAFVCAHPNLREWAYVPIYYKRLWSV